MKDFFKTIKEGFSLLVGAGLFTYGLFSFISFVSRGGIYFNREKINNTLIYLIVGVIFIVFWLVKTRRER